MKMGTSNGYMVRRPSTGAKMPIKTIKPGIQRLQPVGPGQKPSLLPVRPGIKPIKPIKPVPIKPVPNDLRPTLPVAPKSGKQNRYNVGIAK